MKITMLSASMSRSGGGISEAMRQFAIALREKPVTEISIVAGQDDLSLLDLPSWGDVRVRVNRVLGPKAFGWQPALTRALDEERPDLLHLNGLWMYPSIAATAWCNRTGIPRIISPHGMLDPWAVANSGFKKRLALIAYEARNLKGAAVLHALNKAERNAFREFGLTNPIAILPNGIDPAISLGDYGPPPWAEGVPDGSRVLLFLGRLHPKKGLLTLIEALALVPRARMQDWHVVIAGWDQIGHRAELEKLSLERSLSHKVHFTGALFGRAKLAALAAADAFVLPSHSEGLPMSVLEAWAFGLPVLMTDACNLPEGFERGAALRISVDPVELADQLTSFTFFSGPDLLAMGEAGRSLVRESFSWSQLASRFLTISTWALGGGACPPEVEV